MLTLCISFSFRLSSRGCSLLSGKPTEARTNSYGKQNKKIAKRIRSREAKRFRLEKKRAGKLVRKLDQQRISEIPQRLQNKFRNKSQLSEIKLFKEV